MDLLINRIRKQIMNYEAKVKYCDTDLANIRERWDIAFDMRDKELLRDLSAEQKICDARRQASIQSICDVTYILDTLLDINEQSGTPR